MTTTAKSARRTTPPSAVPERKGSSRYFAAMMLVIAALSAVHIIYLVLSRMIPSTDEAHYMTGALSIAEGIRTGTFAGAWNGYLNALGFKAPLVCVPAAAFMLLFGGVTLPCNLSLVLTFAALGLGSYRLFRRCVREPVAIVATAILLSSPMVTGLTHRFYVELLLLALCVWFLDILAQGPWNRTLSSVSLGFVAGLGVLCKLTFLGLMALPVMYTLYVEVAHNKGEFRRIAKLAVNLVLAGAVAAAVAGPWYARNFAAVWKHSKYAASAQSCYYPGWVLMNLSSGPNLFVAGAALIALFFVGRSLLLRRIDQRAARVWILILLLGFATAVACATTVNKATRFSVTWLPAFALLSAALWDYLPATRFRRHGAYVLAGISLLLALQISFAVLPVGSLRAGDLILFDSQFPLNIPGWFNDNHPLDRRDFGLASVDQLIAIDAARRFPPGRPIHVRTTEFGLLINFPYFELVSRVNKHAFEYRWWIGAVVTGPDAPEYIIASKGFKGLYPGTHFYEHYPNIAADVASGRLAYEEIARLDGPENTRIVLYAKKPLLSVAATPRNEGALSIEAESFNRGNATPDRGEHGYGQTIGVIITLKPAAFVEYDFNLERGGNYQMELRYASAEPRPVRVLIDRVLISSQGAGGATGGFDPAHQHWEPAAIVPLKRGAHTLRLESDGVFPHIDQILLAIHEKSESKL